MLIDSHCHLDYFTPAERFLLDAARRAVIEIIQAGFADSDHPGFRGKGSNVLFLRHLFFASVVRVGADGAPDVWQRGQPKLLLGTRQAGAYRHHLADAGFMGARDHVGQFPRRKIIEVAM